MCEINYQKRKNTELFKCLENSNTFHLSKTQNYIPIYRRFFKLNETNYNSINLNHTWHISDINVNASTTSTSTNFFESTISHSLTKQTKNDVVFFKLAPLLDVCKYLTGYYDTQDETFCQLPQLTYDKSNCNEKLLDLNNAAYVDGLFVYLTSILKHQHDFLHGLDYYGSFLAIKNNYTVNIADDLDYLCESDYFNKNQKVLFGIDPYDNNDNNNLTPICIDHNTSVKSTISIQSLHSDFFGDVFTKESLANESLANDVNKSLTNEEEDNSLTNDVNKSLTNEEEKEEDTSLTKQHNFIVHSLKTHSSCSSRTSYTNSDDTSYDGEEDDVDEEDVDVEDEEDVDDDQDQEDVDDEEDVDDDQDQEDVDDEEDIVNVYIPQFPIQIICMENCETTFDELIFENKLTTDEWLSALLQIIMILITYQKAFSFTHNDLHTNNVMYIQTNKKFIYYKCENKIYKVPTFGRLFKIIDFGRSIYTFHNKLFCSDSFKAGNEAATQYNIEPYFNPDKPRIEPNPSFDLCRFACSIYDCVISSNEMKNKDKIMKDPVKKIIHEWCLDDKGHNLMYKHNGDERYPDFKLYKMIARHVHNHVPLKQLERPEFKNFLINNKKNATTITIDIDIDKIPVF
jgi:hypothetical protein